MSESMTTPDVTRRPGGAYAKWVRCATSALSVSDVARAERYLGLLAKTHSNDSEYLRLQAIAHDARGRTQAAVATMRCAMALNPNDAACCNTMACLLDHAYDYDAAVRAARRAVDLDPGFATAWYNLSIVLMHAGCYGDAAEALQRARQLNPADVLVRTKLAELLRDGGRLHEAESAYREILRERPVTGAAWLGLADLKAIKFTAADIEAMRAAAASPGAAPDDRVAIGYSLAKALEDLGKYAESLQALAQAKDRLRSRQPWDAAAFSRKVASILAAFTPAVAPRSGTPLGREVIFVVGLPRSGTTLVEQVLASHHDVEGGGEITDLTGVLSEESARRGVSFPTWVPLMEPVDWARLGRRYLERTAVRRRRRPIHTDKLPSNWVFVDAIMAMLPAARVVCCRRDPLETCFSNYRQYRSRLEYTGNFSDLAAFWNDYDRSVHTFLSRYGKSVFEYCYEGLLMSQERSIRKLLSDAGLPWDDHCIEFWSTARDVHTPSATQVRRPVFSDSSRYERYGTLLDPLRKCLNDVMAASRSM